MNQINLLIRFINRRFFLHYFLVTCSVVLQTTLTVASPPPLTTVTTDPNHFIPSVISQGASIKIPFVVDAPANNGNVFYAQMSDSLGNFAAPTYPGGTIGFKIGTTSDTITTTINCNLHTGSQYRIRVFSTNPNPGAITMVNNGVDLTIQASGGAVSVSIAASPSTPICSGTNVSFTANPTNGGSNPVYQWKINGINTGPNDSTFSDSTLSDQDTITCVMTSNATCVTGSPATSNKIGMTVNPINPVSITISSNYGTAFCTGTNVTFTATPVNGGSTPAYQWKLNGTNVGTNSNTYSSNSLNNGDTVLCELTSNASCATGNPATSNLLVLTVGNNIPAGVTISPNPGDTICSGTNVTFTATPSNGGSSPSYQWKLNGANAGTNSSTYSNNTLADGDSITCIMTSNAGCATANPDTSNEVIMVVNTSFTPGLTISASPNNNICTGTTVTFTAAPSNGGPSPVYQWKKNGVNVGTNSPTYISNSLSTNDSITCIMTSSLPCASVSSDTSNAIIMTVNTGLPASVSVSVNPGNTVCQGANVTFTATPGNGGSTPIYQWKVGGINAGSNSAVFSSNSLANGDTVTCEMISTAFCATNNPATSNAIVMTVTASPAASVSISANPGNTICSGASVTFTATPVNGGTTPSYQWKIGNTTAGTNSATFSSSSLSDNDTVSCIMTSNASCVSGNPDTSNAIIMTVNPSLTAGVTISSSQGTAVCTGTSVTFTAAPSNGGSSPHYQWQVNSSVVGVDSTGYTSSSLNNGDSVKCIMTSSASCISGNPDTSNILVMTVSNNIPATVSVSSSQGTTVCTGASVTFTATPANGGSTPVYQWRIGSSFVGTNSPVFTTNTLINGDTISCIMASSSSCANPNIDTSNAIIMTVTNSFPASVTISSNPGDTICNGSPVTFTANPVNGGTNPSYQWMIGGINVGTNSNAYTTSGLSDGDTVTCIMTSNSSCANPLVDTSNSVTMSVIPISPVSVSISSSAGNTICTGASVTFSAAPTNGGTNPSYQWLINSTSVGTDSINFTVDTLSNGSVVTCVMTSDLSCATGNPAISNPITMSVNQYINASISISISPGDTVCAGAPATFTAIPVNGGASPGFNWFIGSTSTGTNNPVFTTAALADGDSVRCLLTSNAFCVLNNIDTSNTIIVSVIPSPVVGNNIGLFTTICAGDSVVLNGTGAGSYTWSGGPVPVNNGLPFYPLSTATYTVIGTDANGCSDSSGIIINVNNPSDLTNAGITASGQYLCSGDTLVLHLNGGISGTGSTWKWYSASCGSIFEGNGDSLVISPINMGTQPDTLHFYVLGEDLAPCPLWTNCLQYDLTLNPAPVASVLFDSIQICSGSTVNYAINSNLSSGVTYSWTHSLSPDISGATNQSSSNNYHINDTLINNSNVTIDTIIYLINLIYTNTIQCSSSSSLKVIVKPSASLPVITGIDGQAIPDTVSLCSGTEFSSFVISNSSQGGAGYNWSLQPSPSNVTLYQADSSSMLMSIYSSAFSDTFVVNATAFSPPVPGSCPDQTKSFVVISSAHQFDTLKEEGIILKKPGPMLWYPDNTVDSYQWGYDDTLNGNTPHVLQGENFQVFTNNGQGYVPDSSKYYWVLVTKNGCESKIYYEGKYKRGKKTIALSSYEVALSAYPNPNNGRFNLEIAGNLYGKIRLNLINALGECLINQELEKYTDIYDYSFDVHELPSGVYTIMISASEEQYNTRIVKN